MAWIESHQELRDHPKIKKLARLLGIPRAQAIGHLHMLWWWCMDYAPDGSLSGYSDEDIADAAGWEADACSFIEALTNCGKVGGAGFLESGESGRLVVHDWWEYAGRLIEKRRKDAERKRDERNHTQDVQRTSNGRPTDGAGTVPNLTVPNLTNITLTSCARAREETHESAEPVEEIESAETLPIASPEERAICHELKAIKGYPYHFSQDLAFVRELMVDFPRLDILAEVRAWKTYLIDKPLRQTSRPHSQLRNWCRKAEQFAAERLARASPAKGNGRAPRQSRDNTPDYILEDQDDYFRRTAIRATVEPDV